MAAYIGENSQRVTRLSDELSVAFQQMMEGKMELIALFNQLALLAFFVTIVMLLILLHVTFTRRLGNTMQGVERISQGEFGYQVTLQGNNEIAQIGAALNALSSRLQALFGLTQRIS